MPRHEPLNIERSFLLQQGLFLLQSHQRRRNSSISWRGILQFLVAERCSVVLQCAAVRSGVLMQCFSSGVCCGRVVRRGSEVVLQCVAVRGSVLLQSDAGFCSVLLECFCSGVCCGGVVRRGSDVVLQCVAVCGSVLLQGVAVCCSVLLQCVVAVCCGGVVRRGLPV